MSIGYRSSTLIQSSALYSVIALLVEVVSSEPGALALSKSAFQDKLKHLYSCWPALVLGHSRGYTPRVHIFIFTNNHTLPSMNTREYTINVTANDLRSGVLPF